ncbi:MAG: PDGLE domain-containing protein [Actinomycetota bacterium]|nr:PDGLE domain-containing protein [Actinomycetota bacterium]
MKSPGSDLKKKSLWIFLGIAMLAAIILATFVSPWASSSPDGLEKVAEEKQFLEKAEETEPSWKHSPIPDYGGEVGTRAATGLSGFIGVLLTAAVMVGLGFLVFSIGKRKRANSDISKN